MTQIRASMWRASRPLSLMLSFLTVMSFLLLFLLDLPWQPGWCLLFFSLGCELLQSLRDASRGYYVLDAPLFSLGILVFTVADPLMSVLAGTGFPGIENRVYSGNDIGNLSGIIISLFCMCFFIGRALIRAPRLQAFTVIDAGTPLKLASPRVLIAATLISMLAYTMNGGGFSFGNLVYSITARASGYVAFSSSGLGTENPVIALFAQCIPTAIVLWVLSISRKKKLWSFFAALVSAVLFVLYILIGGRSGVIFVLLTVAVFLILRNRLRVRGVHLAVVGLLAVAVLTFQSNYRDRGDVGAGFLEHSPLRGFALNREVAFIAETYGRRLDFIRGPDILPRIVLPIPETLLLFITNPVPRKLWPGKPVDPSFGPYNAERTGKTGFGASSNITPTIPGRFFVIYGFWGVAQIGILFGMLWRFFDLLVLRQNLVTSNRVLISAMLGAVMFISIRDFTFGKFYPFLFLLFFIFLSRLTLRRARSRVPDVPRPPSATSKW